jgi:hypothetical protein
MTRVVVITLSCSNSKAEADLLEYAEEIADLADEAMESQEKSGNIPEGVKYEGIEVLDPDDPDAAKVAEVEILDPEKPSTSK